MEREMINETIEQKTYRLLKGIYGAQPSFKSIKGTNDFKLRCAMIEMAIAEEREANKIAYQALKEMFDNGEEFDGEDGWMVGVDANLWSAAEEAFDCLKSRGAPKDEVSE